MTIFSIKNQSKELHECQLCHSPCLGGKSVGGESGSVLVSIWFWKVPSSQINSEVPHSDSDRLLRFMEVESHVLNGIWQVGSCL